jgi:hypothetical protein
MQTHFVRVECDVTSKIEQQPFVYRIYLGDELFAERNWIWSNCYLEESLQILAPQGLYPIRFKLLNAESGRLKIRNYRVIAGPARIIKYKNEITIEISDAST